MNFNKIAFSIDLDDWYHTPLVAGANFSLYKDVPTFFNSWRDRYDYVTEPTLRLLELLDKHQVRGTFFVIADMVERYPELMEVLKSSPHEIAHHSLHHTVPINSKTKDQTQSEHEWEDELIKAKQVLESFFGREIIGYRAPGAYFADWMIPILVRQGIKYDSSLAYNSFYNKSNLNDLYKQPRTAFWLGSTLANENGDSRLFELPWPNLKLGNFFLPGGGAFFFRLLGFRYFKYLLKQNLLMGDTVFYIHSIDISNETFPLDNFRNRPFYWIGKGKKTERALEKLLTVYKKSFTTCADIYAMHNTHFK